MPDLPPVERATVYEPKQGEVVVIEANAEGWELEALDALLDYAREAFAPAEVALFADGVRFVGVVKRDADMSELLVGPTFNRAFPDG